jgi:hypothetical protein
MCGNWALRFVKRTRIRICQHDESLERNRCTSLGCRIFGPLLLGRCQDIRESSMDAVRSQCVSICHRGNGLSCCDIPSTCSGCHQFRSDPRLGRSDLAECRLGPFQKDPTIHPLILGTIELPLSRPANIPALRGNPVGINAHPAFSSSSRSRSLSPMKAPQGIRNGMTSISPRRQVSTYLHKSA